MNIFVLDTNPITAAQMQCDKHVVKMVLETAQLLCTAHTNPPYKPTHINHPCAVWARASHSNYTWLVIHGLSLSEEYTKRYEKRHKSHEVIVWCYQHMAEANLPIGSLTPFVKCMPDKHKKENIVDSYRSFYINEKNHIAKWNKHTPSPYWWPYE